MKQQALIVDINKLKEIIKDIEESDRKLAKELDIKIPSHKFIIGIRNPKGLSDTWEII